MTSGIRTQKYTFWKEHIEQWQESGLSQPAYCESHGIKMTTFSFYRHRLLNSHFLSEPSFKFVAAEPKTSNSSSPIAALQLMLPNGIRIGVSSDANESLLKMVLNIAGQIPC